MLPFTKDLSPKTPVYTGHLITALQKQMIRAIYTLNFSIGSGSPNDYLASVQRLTHRKATLES